MNHRLLSCCTLSGEFRLIELLIDSKNSPKATPHSSRTTCSQTVSKVHIKCRDRSPRNAQFVLYMCMFYTNPNLQLVFPHPYFYLYQTSGFALALGNLVYGLSVCGHGKAEDLGNRLRPSWIKIVLSEVKVTSCMLV